MELILDNVALFPMQNRNLVFGNGVHWYLGTDMKKAISPNIHIHIKLILGNVYVKVWVEGNIW